MHNPRTFKFLLLVSVGILSFNLSAADYFWIGGSGNWSDISHWATTSGGGTTHSQAPTAGDDVFFDANSFTAPGQVVTLNTDINFCRNLLVQGVTNGPVLRGSNAVTLNVFGALEILGGMTLDYQGHVVFTSDQAGNAVNFAGETAGSTITFSGIGGWTLESAITVDSTFSFQEGTLNTNGQAIDCGYFRSDGEATRQLTLGASTITINSTTYRPYDNAPFEFEYHPFYVDARNLTIDAGSSTITLTADDVDLVFEGPGTLTFNRVATTAPMGNSRVRDWQNYNGFGSEPTVNFTELSLAHRTEVLARFTTDVLTLFPGQAYTFQSGYTFTLGGLNATGDCTAGIGISSTQAGEVATLSSVNDITADFVLLQSISATGGGAFSANDAVDLGNNPGWTINQKPTEDFYWIGNAGNWNEPMNWSATSGGPPSGCIPSVTDNVFFDANSFDGPGQLVTLDAENNYCRNIDWTGATGTPVLAGAE
ncbi:MAG: hypothetical protein AAF597_06800, partial [Bacteroidota bacterium]